MALHLRRIYTQGDLLRTSGLKSVPNGLASNVLKTAFDRFNGLRIYDLETLGDRRPPITDRETVDENRHRYVIDGSLAEMAFEEDYIEPRFGGKQIIPKRVAFYGNHTHWQATDKLFYLFGDYIVKERASLRDSINSKGIKVPTELDVIKFLREQE